MKVLVILAVLCLLQVIAGQVTKEGQQLQQHNQGDHENNKENSQVAGHKGQVTQSNQDQQQATSQSEHETQNVAQQHVAGQQHSSTQSKVPGKIPSKVQQIVNQVSQHVPNVVEQHVANKQRMVRSVKNRQNWQELQVNAFEQPGKCEFICDQPNVTACGYNGRCYWQFESQCELNIYNCLNTEKIFSVVDSHKCLDEGAPKCYRGDL